MKGGAVKAKGFYPSRAEDEDGGEVRARGFYPSKKKKKARKRSKKKETKEISLHTSEEEESRTTV